MVNATLLSVSHTTEQSRDEQIRQRPEPTDRILPGTRALLVAFAGFTLLAAVDLSVFTTVTERYFAWTIVAQPGAAFLGAAYAAGFVLSLLCLRRQRWSEVRIAVSTVSAFTVVTLVATVLHLDRFHCSLVDRWPGSQHGCGWSCTSSFPSSALSSSFDRNAAGPHRSGCVDRCRIG